MRRRHKRLLWLIPQLDKFPRARDTYTSMYFIPDTRNSTYVDPNT